MPKQFEGFGDPNYTPVPNLFLRQIGPQLSGSAVKVMLYIFSHTYGFQDENGDRKTHDAISWTQFLHGVVTREGRQLDIGAGVSNGALRPALEELVEEGLIFKHTTTNRDGGTGTSVYELNRTGQPTYPHIHRAEYPMPENGMTKEIKKRGINTPAKKIVGNGIDFNKPIYQKLLKEQKPQEDE